MKNKPFEMCLLFDFYGELLTDKQRELFDLYYNEDLSLAEISEHVNITRQAVRDAIMRGEHILRETEQKLGLVARYSMFETRITEIVSFARSIERLNSTSYKNPQIAAYTDEIQKIADTMK